MQKIKIAIIDNGVDEAALGNEISGKVYVNEKKECVYDEADMSRVRFAHGTICAAIIQKYLANSEIYSIRLLNEDGSGLIEHLKPALDWCIEKGIYLVNLSLGTTHFRDKSLIRTLVNHYVSKGMCIVAATSNSGYESYPASFSNIIGVATHSSFFSDSLKRLFLGINILGESEHTLRLYGVASVTQKCNSYIGNLVQGKQTTPNHKVKKTIIKEKCEWIRIEKNHEPVITDRDFEVVQRLLAMDTRTSPDREEVYPLSGVVTCGGCGIPMVRKTSKVAKRKLTKELVDAFVSEIVFYDGNIEVKLLYDDFLKELLKVAEEREVSSNG